MTPRVPAGVVLCLLLSPARAHAAACTLSTTGVAFSNYDPTVTADSTMTGTASINCTYLLTGASATLTIATGGSATFTNRKMTAGAQSLTYNLYLDAAHTQIFGDGTAGTATFTGCYLGLAFPCPGGGLTSGQTYAVPVYGLLPARQDVSTGMFMDMMVLTVTF